MKVILFGVFDLLHPGHVAAVEEAATHGELTVIVTPDTRVRQEKGRAPHFTQGERLRMIAALKGVNKAVLGDTGEEWTVVQRLAPDIICVGHDQREDHPRFLAQLDQLPKRPKIVRLQAWQRERYASSIIRHDLHEMKTPTAIDIFRVDKTRGA